MPMGSSWLVGYSYVGITSALPGNYPVQILGCTLPTCDPSARLICSGGCCLVRSVHNLSPNDGHEVLGAQDLGFRNRHDVV
jgi:hypothetical protein